MSKLVNLIAEFEGLELKAYRCSANVPTIGIGNTFYEDGSKVKMGDVITKERALLLGERIVNDFKSKVQKLVKSQVSENQLNALVSLAYNIGMGNFSKSTLLKLVNINPNDAMIAKEFLKWNKAAGKELKGLTNRRIAESALYFTK